MSEIDLITLAHGSGGRLYQQMVEEIFVPAFNNTLLSELNDSSVCMVDGGRIALTTDSFVVRPRWFPGGDIGHLAVCGTVNDLAVSGAQPRYLTCGMIIEAGFSFDELRRVCASMAQAARQAGVMIVTGDTKVVEKGSGDGIYINTAGVGVFPAGREPLLQRVLSGDKLLVSGTIGDHGMAVMTVREQLEFSPPLVSDAAPLNGLVETLLTSVSSVHALRDATRGGVAAVTNEWAMSSGCALVLDEETIPVNASVHAACELLGMDPLHVANEGKFIAAVAPEQADAALQVLRSHPLGKNAAIIGWAEPGKSRVELQLPYGTRRIVDLPDGEQLPRIC